MKVKVHTDACTNLSAAEIQAILSRITALISEAVLQHTTETEELDDAA